MFQDKFPKSYLWTKKHIEKRRRYLNLKRTNQEQEAINVRNTALGRFSMCAIKRWQKTGVTPVGETRVWRQHDQRAFMVIKTEKGFVHYNRFVFEQHHGPIPKGMIVAHKDGDFLNNEIDNLELITISQHMMRIEPSKKLSDNYIAGIMSPKDKEKRKLIKQNPHLIELQRTIFKTQRLCKKLKNQTN